MAQVEQNRRKLGKILQHFASEIDRIGLAEQFCYEQTSDPWINLQNAHANIISILDSSSTFSSISNHNESIILDCLKSFVNIHEEMSHYSKLLYEGNYSLTIYKSYRKLYEEISKTSNCLYQVDSKNEDFLRQKQRLISQNLIICEEIQHNSGVLLKDESQKLDMENNASNKVNQQQQLLIIELQSQIQMLNNMIRQNDEEFTQQIQRYNSTLFDLQETIREYELRMDKIRQYEATIDGLQHNIFRLKEEKYRDDMLIQNMSKKIRVYEKERGGAEAFLSPRSHFIRKNMGSPSNRTFNQSLIGPHLSSPEPKFRNFYGQRLVSE